MSVRIYTDGSSLGNPWSWGRAAVIIRDWNQKIISGHVADATNNEMELTAAIEWMLQLIRELNPWFSLSHIEGFGWSGSGLFEQAAMKKKSKDQIINEKIELSTDSEYVRKGVTERLPTRVARGRRRSKWGKIIENVQLRQTIHALLPQFSNLTRHRVKGHAGDPMNEIVDELARGAALKMF